MLNKNFKIDKTSDQPIYKQIVSYIYDEVDNGDLKQGDLLPSVNEIAEEFKLSRDSVFKAYNELRATGIIQAVPGKGYYIASTHIKTKEKIFFLLDEFSDYKKELFREFKKKMGSNVTIDLFFHNYNVSLMEKMIKEAIGNYTHYIVWPVMTPKVKNILKIIPSSKLYIIDAGIEWYFKTCKGVFQNYADDICSLFKRNIQLFKKYKNLTLVFPQRLLLYEIKRGFKLFLKENHLHGHIISSVENIKIEKGDAFFVIDDEDLIHLVKEGERNKLRLGRDMGIIAYNETPLKSIAAGGISVLSTDFGEMGFLLATMIRERKKQSIQNPSSFFIRKSL